MKIENNTVVSLTYKLTNHKTGETIEETTTENPMLFLYGVGAIIPEFEQNLNGKVTGDKAKQTITLTKDEPIYFSKFKRYARGKSTIHAHVPGCIDVTSGDHVLTAECRPISKSVSYVVIEVKA